MSFISSTLASVMPSIAIVSMISQRSHILMALLSLEAMILGITYSVLMFSATLNSSEMFISLIILTFGACEASLGLACLVSMARTFGNDKIASSSLSWC
uniref:NADH-ubiquinone oxidoreductase chain 4L n=1 Tax=Pisione sp. YZ-2018 TaxID=2153337 RepID=A0A343W6I9_9ANNE|nr:NADH dehydrogenase subunit 4L [Pisione sp. YZ-2018]